MTPNVEKVISEVQSLSNEELRELRERIDKILARPKMTEEEFDRHLLAKGIITRIPPKLSDEEIVNIREFRPIEILDGKPVSETLIEERR